jgi:hypothetical protein
MFNRDVDRLATPTHNAVALAWVMTVDFETARTVFKFDSDPVFRIGDVLVGDTIRIGLACGLNAVLQLLTPISPSGACWRDGDGWKIWHSFFRDNKGALTISLFSFQ